MNSNTKLNGKDLVRNMLHGNHLKTSAIAIFWTPFCKKCMQSRRYGNESVTLCRKQKIQLAKVKYEQNSQEVATRTTALPDENMNADDNESEVVDNHVDKSGTFYAFISIFLTRHRSFPLWQRQPSSSKFAWFNNQKLPSRRVSNTFYVVVFLTCHRDKLIAKHQEGTITEKGTIIVPISPSGREVVNFSYGKIFVSNDNRNTFIPLAGPQSSQDNLVVVGIK